MSNSKKDSDKMYKSATATCKNIHEPPKHNTTKQVKQRQKILLYNYIYTKAQKQVFLKKGYIF